VSATAFNSAAAAADCRDALAKAIYSKLFDWLVALMNASMHAPSSAHSLGILDIYGCVAVGAVWVNAKWLITNYGQRRILM
jgi:hypothetical protein